MASKPYHQMSYEDFGISSYEANLVRKCEICDNPFKIADFEPYQWGGGASTSLAYRGKCECWCLACYLGVGPTDFPDDELTEKIESDPAFAVDARVLEPARASIQSLQIGPDWKEWTSLKDDRIYEAKCKGEILSAYSFFTDRNIPLVIMPLTKAISVRPIHYPNGITYYPPGTANLEGIDTVDTPSEPTGALPPTLAQPFTTLDNLSKHGLLIFPVALAPALIARADHDFHLELIRRLSEEVDKVCLNFVRYYTCTLDKPHSIPARAGQTDTDPAMSMCLVYDPEQKTSRIYGGAAFPFAFIGTGIWLKQPEWPNFPGDGEVGHIVQHALSIYAINLEARSDTLRFVQSLSMLEFLAYPTEYKAFEEVKKVIARYIATDQSSYNRILERFFELTGKKDPETRAIIGLRTRVVHIGDRIESLIPDPAQRRLLFAELDGYIRAVMDHMIQHSDIDFKEYVQIRKTLPAFLHQSTTADQGSSTPPTKALKPNRNSKH